MTAGETGNSRVRALSYKVIREWSMSVINIGGRQVGQEHPTYFIADIAANHDGDFDRAVKLIQLAKEAGADAAKFQNFSAPEIVSRYGFENLRGQFSHQAGWKKSVFEVYQDASIPVSWTQDLKMVCDEVGIEYLSTPYDFQAVDMLEPHVPAFKIGSGDIAWGEMLTYIARKGKPVLLATGASDIGEVSRAVNRILEHNSELVLMQCNTNYTGSIDNFQHIHLNVLKSYGVLFPHVVLGLSDHTPGHATVLGAVALGASVVEKHFTDDNSREGPDHGFSMSPDAWREMVDRVRELEKALGHAQKRIESNESETVIIQRRCVRAARDIAPGEILRRDDLKMLRPAPRDGISPWDVDCVVGMRSTVPISQGEYLRWCFLGDKETGT